MIQANELRIGNYVKFLNTEIQVTGISNRFAATLIETKQFIDSKLFHYKPIPLTEEWLIKFGFIKDGKEFNKWCGDYEYSFSFEYGFVFGQLVDYSHEIKIKHVHQLQNLYFALTGEELTIKEDETKK